MILTFITADVPLTKNLESGGSYPLVKNVTSETEEVYDIKQLQAVLKSQASRGNAFLTGNLIRPIIKETRAGLSELNAPTEVLVLDVDADLPYTRPELLELLGINASYVFQHSTKSQSEDSIRGHYFFHLDKPYTPAEIKKVLIDWNFKHLNKYLELSKSYSALKWPLDIIVNDSGRYVYIAPPIGRTYDFEHITYIKGESEKLTLPEPKIWDPMLKVNSLRRNQGMKDAEFDNKGFISAKDIKITGIKEERGRVYLNLNGGDSWGYYFTPGDEIVQNFKGEPKILLKELDPELFAKHYMPPPERPSGGAPLMLDENNKIVPSSKAVLGFRSMEEDVYYQVIYDPATMTIINIATTNSKNRLNDFLIYHGASKLGVVPDGEVIFDPTDPVQIDPVNLKVNIWRPTEYQLQKSTNTQIPKYINKLIRHLTVDDECYHYFLNWLAYVYQKRQKTGTSWLFHGNTSTGKGTLFAEVLQPIFGHRYTHQCTEDNAVDMYNQHMAHCLILFVDEFDIKDDINASRAFNKLKNYITEETLTIRAMRSNQTQVKNFTNVIFASNSPTPIKADETERRINIPPRQEHQLTDLPMWRERIKHELHDFCGFLQNYEVNEHDAKHILKNKAREDMINASKTSHEGFFEAFKNGDLEFFNDFVLKNPPIYEQVEYANFENILKGWCDHAGETMDVLLTDLKSVYEYVTGAKKTPLNKFGVICNHNGIQAQRMRKNGAQRRYATTTFKEFEIDFTEVPNNIVSMR
jgi:hypothetical protein